MLHAAGKACLQQDNSIITRMPGRDTAEMRKSTEKSRPGLLSETPPDGTTTVLPSELSSVAGQRDVLCEVSARGPEQR